MVSTIYTSTLTSACMCMHVGISTTANESTAGADDSVDVPNLHDIKLQAIAIKYTQLYYDEHVYWEIYYYTLYSFPVYL